MVYREGLLLGERRHNLYNLVDTSRNYGQDLLSLMAMLDRRDITDSSNCRFYISLIDNFFLMDCRIFQRQLRVVFEGKSK